jgi:prolyl-tRNA synthetase
MRQSQFFSKTIKDDPKDEISLNAKLLYRAGFIDKLMAGVYSLLPLGLVVEKKIEKIIREEMINVGGQEILMPSLQPKENWEITGRWKNFDSLVYLGFEDEEKNMILGPTHEEVVVPLAKRFIKSYKDLPKYVFQFQNKFRYEKRAKSGLIRGREFIMKDLYSFHVDVTDLDAYYEKIKKAYSKIFWRCGIGDKTYLTYASGGDFCKFSHEFQTLSAAGEDVIYICDKCKIAINKEIIESLGESCPQCGNKNLQQAKSIEVGNIFKLINKFSSPFDLNYLDKNGIKQTVAMGCYGIGLQRLMGTAAENNNDKNGIIWPEEIAPFQVHLLEIGDNKSSISYTANLLYNYLQKSNIEVLYDDRENISAGEKFADADLIGCPMRLVMSEKTLLEDCVELKMRNSDKVEKIKIDDVIHVILKHTKNNV